MTASRALKLIKVEYEEYPVVVSPKISMRGTEHPIHLDKKDNSSGKIQLCDRRCGQRNGEGCREAEKKL